MMMAQQLDLEPGEFIWTGGDVHIYDDHVDQVAEQLTREPYPYPQLRFTRKPSSIFDYAFDDLELVNYRHHPTIKAPIAV
jgi:thymidylate synthase